MVDLKVTADELIGVGLSVEEYRDWQMEGRSLVDLAAAAALDPAVTLQAE